MKRAVRAFLFLVAVPLVPKTAEAFDLSAGVDVGAMLLGTRPRLAVRPNIGIAWRTEGGLLLALSDACSILPATDAHGVGVYNHASVSLGYAWPSGRFSVGPALAMYSTPACGQRWCGRLTGLSPGGAVQLDYYFSEWLGVSASATVDWLTGSDVLPAGAAASVFVGPLLKWSSK